MKDLDTEFQRAVQEIVNNTERQLPQDTMLQLYACYKQATKGDSFAFNSDVNLRDGFKLNAWRQLKGLSEREAKTAYINLVNNIFK